jgi:hypothetical protein
LSPLPCNAAAMAPSVAANSFGLMVCSSGSVSSSTFSSSMAEDDRSCPMTAPARSGTGEGASGGTSATYRSPNSVLGSSRAVTLDGI